MDSPTITKRDKYVAEELSDGYDKKELDDLEKQTQYAIKYADLQRQHRDYFIFSHKERRHIRHDKLKIERFEHHFLKLSRHIQEYENADDERERFVAKRLIDLERSELKKLDFVDPISLKEEILFLEELLNVIPENERDELETTIRSMKNELENEKLLSHLEEIDEASV